MRNRFAIVVAVLLLAGCDARRPSTTSTTGTSSARLIGGTADPADPAVVIVAWNGEPDCTAEFISPTVLLTAAHCVLSDSYTETPTDRFSIYRGHDVSQAKPEDWIPIDPSNVHAHPSFKGDEHDIAVLVLKEPITDVTPFPFATEQQAALTDAEIGKPIRLIGYGANVASGATDGFGLKRQLNTTINGLDKHFVHVGKPGETACGGDSGGPALVMINGVETIVGIDSYSPATIDCSDGEHYQRVDTESAFIQRFLNPIPPAPPAAETRPPMERGDAPAEKGPDSHGPEATAADEGCAMGPVRRTSSAAPWGSSSAPLLFVVAALAAIQRSKSRRRGRSSRRSFESSAPLHLASFSGHVGRLSRR